MPELLDATYDAIRRQVAWRVVRRDGVVVSGPGALEWLQGQLSQDIARLGHGDPIAGLGLETLVLSPQGKIDSFCRICSIGADRYLLDVRAGFGESLHDRLRRFKLRVKADLELVDNLHAAEIRGPSAPVAPDPVTSENGTILATLSVSWPGWSGHDVLLTGAPGSVDATSLGLEASVAGDDGAFEAARIEAGVPQLGSELTERTIPQEAGDLVARAVSFTKGCYTGQELVARIDARGSKTPRRLHGIVIGGGAAPVAGAELRIGGDKVGELTSVAWSPGFGSYVGLGYLKRGIEAPVEVSVASVATADDCSGLIRALPLFEE